MGFEESGFVGGCRAGYMIEYLVGNLNVFYTRLDRTGHTYISFVLIRN